MSSTWRRSSILRPALLTAVLIAAVLPTGCGTEGAPPTAAPAEDSGAAERLVSCGGEPGWPVSVMATGVPGLLTPDEARATFEQVLADPQLSAEAELTVLAGGPGTEYRVLAGDDSSLVLGVGEWTEDGPADRGAWVLGLEREGDRWTTRGWGDCSLLGPLPPDGRAWARVEEQRAEGRTLTLQVSESGCTSARDPRPFLHDPEIDESAEEVVVRATSTPLEGFADCPGNPSVPVEVTLAEPLGDRRVLDGSHHPPRPVPAG